MTFPEDASKRDQLEKLLRERQAATPTSPRPTLQARPPEASLASGNRFETWPEIEALRRQKDDFARAGLENPYFQMNEGVARGTTTIAGRTFINFANYNYLGLSGDPRVSAAAQAAIERYGTSVSASRIASGERPVHRQLEQALADLHGVEACLTFVGGHATNVTVIGHLFGTRDLILRDSLIHNSAALGSRLSGARRLTFRHNDLDALERLLEENRHLHERALIVVEGVYSMDGDQPDLAGLVELRDRFDAVLMVDEAHSLGVLGETGRGIAEHAGVAGHKVDITMGTLSKSLASCGGYIAGNAALIEYLRYTAPGFLYSVGMTPPNAAAAHESVRIMLAEPERSSRVRAMADRLLSRLRGQGLDVGLSGGSAVVPLIVGDSLRSIAIANFLFDRGINVQPALAPAVEEKAARLRFFVTSVHTAEQIDETVARCAEAWLATDTMQQ